jgi:hypothetical protein
MAAGRSTPEHAEREAGPVASPQVAALAPDASTARVLALQRSVGNAAVHRLLRPGAAVVQRLREEEFRADPPGFLKANKVTMDMAKGLRLRYPDADLHNMIYEGFVGQMDQYKFARHWFVLQPDPDNGIYIVTPAIEKYIEYAPDWAKHINPKLLATVKRTRAAPPKGGFLTAAYFPYLIGVPSDDDFGRTVGHTDLPKQRPVKGKGADDFDPDFAFTGFMNGCAFSVTPVPQDPSKFTIWHFQSSTAYKKHATTFRMANQPSDWFGENEYYPREMEPEGVTPKVTNFLYRGKDDAWRVASQINYVESESGRVVKGEPSAPKGRALAIDGAADALARLRGIYLDGMENALNTRIRHVFDVCREHQAVVKGDQALGVDVVLQKFEADIEKILLEEEDKLKAATSVAGLHGVALGISKNRAQNQEIVNSAADSLIRAFTSMEETETKKSFFFKSEDRRKAYAGMRIRLGDVKLTYNETGWLAELIKETTPPPPSSELPKASSAPEAERESAEPVGDVAPVAVVPPAVVAPTLALFAFLDSLDPGWNVAPAAQAGGQGMIVGQGGGVMLGDAEKTKEVAPVLGEIRLPGTVRFLTNNGSGALCFVYSVVMGLTGRTQGEVEAAVAWIVRTAGVEGGWIASDSDAARRVLDAAQLLFGIPIQVIELQNSVAGLIISGRSHNASRDARHAVVLRNTGAHYDAIV